MKSRILSAIFISTALLGACGVNEQQNAVDDDTVYHNNGNTINLHERADDYNDKQRNSKQFGFVRQVKNPNQGEAIQPQPMKSLNREDTANNISYMLVTLENVEDATVLVTDQEVLVAYLINDDHVDARIKTAKQVRSLTSNSVQDWYNVYITDDPTVRQNVKNIASMNSLSPNKDETVQDTVKLMLDRSPQGDNALDKQWLDNNQ